MATRKVEVPVDLGGCPDHWIETVRKTSETDEGIKVIFEDVSSEELKKQQLDPAVVTLENLLANNITINPQAVTSLLNQTDIADINELADQLSSQAYEKITQLPNFSYEKNTLVKPEQKEVINED